MEIRNDLFKKDIQFFLNTIDKPTVILAPDHTIEMVNDCFFHYFPYEVGSHFKDMLAPNEYEHLNIILKELSITEAGNEQFTVYGKDDQVFKMRIYMYFDPLTNRSTIVMDQPKQQNSIDWKKVFYHSDTFELILDDVGSIFDVNVFAMKALKSHRANLIGKSIEEVIQTNFNEYISFKKIKEHLESKSYYEFVRAFEYKKGKEGFYKVSVKKDPSENLYMIRVVDWTEHTLMEQKLTQKDSLLEVGHLAASIAHEIRNPITTLKGFIQLMEATADETTTKYLAVINDEVDRMEAILSEMLQLAKPTSYCKDIVCVAELLSTIEQVIYPKATYEGVELLLINEFEGDPFILGEEGKLKQVLLNLLKNSLEAMEGGKLTIQMKNTEPNCVTVLIHDTGKGIDEEHIQKVFMPYFTTRQTGTGLGLPFVLKTVEEHGGTISVSSKIGEGTCFIMTFPLAADSLSPLTLDDQALYLNQ